LKECKFKSMLLKFKCLLINSAYIIEVEPTKQLIQLNDCIIEVHACIIEVKASIIQLNACIIQVNWILEKSKGLTFTVNIRKGHSLL
jgi:hypothetical protein